MSKNSLCWKGRIRTAVPVREQIYSLSVLTTHPPSSIGNRNNFIRNLVRTLKYSTSHTIRELYLVCTLALNALPACYSTLPLFPFAEREGFEPPDLWQSTVFKTAAFDHSATSPIVHPTGVEPVTYALEVRCSLQLSYGCKFGTEGRIRTGTDITVQGILSPSWLPFHHIGNLLFL